MSKAYVLLSGGIDSTTCLYIAAERHKTVTAVSVDYGQRHSKEIGHARTIVGNAVANGEPWEWTMAPLSTPMKGMLLDASTEVPNAKYDELTGVSPTYVPFRNGQLLSLLAAIAVQDSEAEFMYFGAHAEDAANWAYPDCTPEFIGAMANAIYIGTYHKIRLVAPLEHLTKDQIIKWGVDLRVPYENTWSCYKGENLHCGKCPTCYARHEAFLKASVIDPTTYANYPVR